MGEEELNRQIAIWGAGNQGRYAYYALKREYDVAGFLDADVKLKQAEIVDGKKVLDFYPDKYFIIIACGGWIDVSRSLIKKGLKLCVDFIPYNMFLGKNVQLDILLDCFGVTTTIDYLNRVKNKKKIALIYGNCQVEIIANMMEYNKDFEKQYLLLRVPQVHLYRCEKQIDSLFYSNGIMQLIDLFIYQNVKANNRYNRKLGTVNILNMLSSECRKMPIHNIYFDGYFIQYDTNEERYLRNMNEKDFPYTDYIVEELLENNKNTDEIMALINDENLVEPEKIIEKCRKSIDNLRDRERNVEIPIVDYIEKGYIKEQLFYTHNHPKNKVMYEYVKRILRALGINKADVFTEEELDIEFGTLRLNNFPIFPCVIKALKLEKYESKMRISYIDSHLVTMDEYIREYLFRCYEMK